MYIAISGNLGSGKSTLAKGLGRHYGYSVYPRTPYDFSYIEALFSDPNRWTFEAQVSFLFHKYSELVNASAAHDFFILDRTIYEDIEVFAAKFFDDGRIDQRSMALLNALYRDLCSKISPPQLIIYCDCAADVCRTRIESRPRSYQGLYPDNHIERLEVKLVEWRQRLLNIPVLTVNTSEHDFRSGEAIIALAGELDAFIEATSNDEQLDLFSKKAAIDLNHEMQFKLIQKFTAKRRSLNINKLRQRKKIYLAAPFSSHARNLDSVPQSPAILFESTRYIEGLPLGYRRQLSRLASSIGRHGYDVLLPHRDINQWGRKTYPPGELSKRCIESVLRCDYFFGIVGESFGCHTELGCALGAAKPSIIALLGDNKTSFFANDIASGDLVKLINSPSLTSLIEILSDVDVISQLLSGVTK